MRNRNTEEPEYMLINAANADVLADLEYSERVILLLLARESEYNKHFGGLTVVLYPQIRKDIQKIGGWKNVQSVSRALRLMNQKGVIKRMERNVYLLNPDIFVKKGGKKRA